MIKKEELIIGTISEIEDYIINKKEFGRWLENSNFDSQITKIMEKDPKFGFIFYIRKPISSVDEQGVEVQRLIVEKEFILIRE